MDTFNFKQKPFLKWLGGKTQIINHIISKLPPEINSYHELFLGGGSVLLTILQLQKQNKITINKNINAYDINYKLINTYNHVQKNPVQLFNIIQSYINKYNQIKNLNEDKKITAIEKKKLNQDNCNTSKEKYYYWMRNKFNIIDKDSIECAALFIIINKLCFRGMYREGPDGFNVPFGNYKKTPTLFSMNELNSLSKLIENVQFVCLDYKKSINNIENNDFVYLDPPYFPNNDKSFVHYVKNGFNIDDHNDLFNKIKNFKNIKFILSNSDVSYVKDKCNEFKIQTIEARRAINSKDPSSMTNELLIHNY